VHYRFVLFWIKRHVAWPVEFDHGLGVVLFVAAFVLLAVTLVRSLPASLDRPR
jgi:hypothetical protein